MDPEVRANVDDEFNSIWNSLVADINAPLKKLREAAAAKKAAEKETASTYAATGYKEPTLTKSDFATITKEQFSGGPNDDKSKSSNDSSTAGKLI